MHEPDVELEGWQRQWQSQDAVPPDLVRAVNRGTRRMRQGIVWEVAVTVVMGGGALAWATTSPRSEVFILSIAVWLFIGIAWIASTLLRRGAWHPLGSTTAAFVEISILRCQRNLQALWIQAALYVVISTFNLVWIYKYQARTGVIEFLAEPIVIGFLVFVTPSLAGIWWWYRRRLLRELANLVSLSRGIRL
ncbi:MAG TPA: hypothetical protein VKB50_06785 [Vicinamibacterales bacterium]|nr:hypothetical protein [Vicinamibacterales bacterium]